MSNIPWRDPSFTQEELKRLLRYDRKSGFWYWRMKRSHRVLKGQRAGCVNKTDGRRYIRIDKGKYSEHRLAWFYVKGTWPRLDVEHKDGTLLNNAWTNLRLATRTQNQGNARARVKFKGVSKVRTGKYTAQIQKSGIKLHIGTFDTPEQAHKAYVRRAKQLYGEFARAA